MRARALQQRQFNAAHFRMFVFFDHLRQTCRQAAELRMAKAVGRGGLGLRNKRTVRVVDALGNSDEHIVFLLIDAVHIREELLHVKIDFRQVNQIRSGAAGRCQRGAAGQPAGVAAHDLHDRDRAGVIHTAVFGHFHAGGRYVLGSTGKTGAVIGAEKVVVDGLGHTHHAAVPIVRLHIAADLVAGVHGVVAAVIEEVAHVVFLKDLQNAPVIRIVRVRVRHFVAAGAQLRRRRVQQQAELVRFLLADIIQAIIQNAADAVGRTVNVGNGIGFQRGLEHSVGTGIDDCSRPAGLPKDTRAFQFTGHNVPP